MTAATLLQHIPNQSTYMKRGLSRKSEAEQERSEKARAQAVAVQTMRQANQWEHTFSICVRSLSALARRMPTAEWRRQTRMRALLARSTATEFLKMVMAVRRPSQPHTYTPRTHHAHTSHTRHTYITHTTHTSHTLLPQVRPGPGFLRTSAVQHFVFDQKYAKKGESRGKHRGAERVDASGDLVELVSTVLVNVMRTSVPQTLGRLASSILELPTATLSTVNVLQPACAALRVNLRPTRVPGYPVTCPSESRDPGLCG
jgi:hypothetical protein